MAFETSIFLSNSLKYLTFNKISNKRVLNDVNHNYEKRNILKILQMHFIVKK